MNKAKFLKITMTYFLGNILTKILTFLLIPIYTKYLSTEMFGYYDLSVSVITLVIPIIFFQIWDGMFRFIYDYKEQKDKQKIITNGMLISLVGCVLYAIGIIGTQIIPAAAIAPRMVIITTGNPIVGLIKALRSPK